MPLRALDEALAGGAPPVILLVGDEALLVRRGVERAIEAIRPTVGIEAFNFARQVASEADPGALFAAARTLPMMADRRLVVVTGIEKGDDAFFAALTDYLAAPPDSTVLVIAGSGFPAVRKGGSNWSARVQNAVKKAGVVVTVSADAVSPARFAVEQARALGCALAPEDAGLLVELVGTDLGRIEREIDKIALFVEQVEVITAQDIHAACSLLAEGVVWDLTAALATRDGEGAIAALHHLLEGGDASHRLMSLVAWQLRSALRVAELQRAGKSDNEIRRAVRMRYDVYQKVRRVVADGRARGAAEVFETLTAANRAMNRHKAGDRRVFEDLVVRLCGDDLSR